MASKKSELSEAVVKLRNSFGESQQAFSNRVGLAINTLARYETSRSPSGYVLVTFEKLASEKGLSDVAQVFKRAIDEELKAAGLNRGAFVAPVRVYFAGLLDELQRLVDRKTGDPDKDRILLEEIHRKIDWPRLHAHRQMIEQLERLSEATSKIHFHQNPTAEVEVIGRTLPQLRALLESGAGFDDYFSGSASPDKVQR